MTTWDLSRLQYTVRKLTGQFDETQLPTASPSPGQYSVANPPGVDDYINDFYNLEMPEQFRSLKLKDYFTFTTIPNVGTYNIGQNIYQLEPPIYIDGYQGTFLQDNNQFFTVWPQFNFIDFAVDTTDGTSVTYTFTLTQTPVQQGTVSIGLEPNLDGNPSPQLETFTDVDTPALLDQPTQIKFTNPGILTGNLGGTGTIDYLTGAVSITYAFIPNAGININAHYHPYVASRPRDCLFFQNQLFLRPIPNDVYQVSIISYVQPTVALSMLSNAATKAQFDGTLTDVPLFNEWWYLIALGAALRIMTQEGDHDEYARYKMYFEEQKLLCQRRTLKELANKRINTPYSPDNVGLSSAWPIFPYY
jgi:hypothetical protein